MPLKERLFNTLVGSNDAMMSNCNCDRKLDIGAIQVINVVTVQRIYTMRAFCFHNRHCGLEG